MATYTRYTDFLKDPQFIRWQIMPDDTLNSYWQQFVKANPHLSDELEHAISYLKTTGFNNSELAPLEQEQLMERIRETIDERHQKRRIRRLVRYFSAACIFVLVAIGGVVWHLSSEKRNAHLSQKEMIVGNMLNSEDIRLITGGGKTLSFQNDIQAEVDESGNALKITSGENSESTTVEMHKSEVNKLVVPYGKRTQLTLSDGTRVWLNSGSVLEFPAVFDGKTREIRINGEIYIEVAQNPEKPFYVHTHDFTVNVFGTRFNVSSYIDSPSEVVLVEGSIALETTGGKNSSGTKMQPGERATFASDGAIEKVKVDVSKYVSWKDGYIVLSETPVAEVLQQIGRLYNLSFDMGSNVNLKNKGCSGKLVLSENLDDVLSTLAALSETTYERNNTTIIITSKN